MAYISRFVLVLAVATAIRVENEDLENSEPHEVMIAQESRNYHTFIAPPVRIIKPSGVTNSHRPQYDLDSLEEDLVSLEVQNFLESTTRKSLHKTYNPHNSMNKEGMIRDAVLRALERKNHVGKFAQVLPIIRAMSGSQRVALASLVASQVSTPPGRTPLNLSQVRSMFGNENNSTTELMLPILLDMANLIRRAVRPGKEQRDVKLPQTQFMRRSFIEDISLSDEFDPGVEEFQPALPTTTKAQQNINRNTRARSQRTLTLNSNPIEPLTTDTVNKTNKDNKRVADNFINTKLMDKANQTSSLSTDDHNNVTAPDKTELSQKLSVRGRSMAFIDNSTLDLTADASNQTIHELPVAEKLRSLNRYVDRNGNIIRRGGYTPKLPPVARRTTAEPVLVSSNGRRRPFQPRKPALLNQQSKCELFSNTVCLRIDDYPTDAIVQSIRRNKAAAGALLADFKDPGEGAVDGITPAQEAKYNAEHYLVSNSVNGRIAPTDRKLVAVTSLDNYFLRRGDTAKRDFASAGEAGFMCPSTVKYARPQKARATSGQWKYIVNTGEHTQTLRLEKCLKPKESCTYLTDNFKSKCVQVYNYHRLLTWDQQNGLHMDIFKVPTCCSCHIEGYSVSFPPLGQRLHETSSEHFPGEELSSEHGNQAFENVQSTVQKPALTKINKYPFNKAVDIFPTFVDTHNTIPGPLFTEAGNDDDEFNNMSQHNLKDSYGNYYFPDSLNQASSIRNIRKPQLARNPLVSTGLDTATLPSYLEPPGLSSFTYSKENLNAHKNADDVFKRGISRQNRRPIRKKISSGTEDLLLSGTSTVGAYSSDSLDSKEVLSTDVKATDLRKTANVNNINARPTIKPKLQGITSPRPFSTLTLHDQKKFAKEEMEFNGKRVNYNYHPIIDFFEEEEEDEGNESIDREDNVPEFLPSTETEWKPLNRPISDVKN